MLDIRAVAYVAPVSEVDFASVALTVRIANVADETGLVSGIFRVYNNSTGLLIHSSDIVPFSISAGQTIDASALTDFDPPAPADDTYFVVFDGSATNALVPAGIGIHLGSFYFDVKPTGMGPAPAAHHATHEDGGSDEIDVSGLSGLLADEQDPLDHASDHAVGGGDTVDHNTLDNLTVGDVHTQYRLRHEIFYETDAFWGGVGSDNSPWRTGSRNSGSMTEGQASALHPGIFRLSSSTSANSGIYVIISGQGVIQSILLAGAEQSCLWHRPQTLSGTTRHHGFHDTSSVSDPVDGAWIWQDPATGIIYGRTMSNSVGSTTGTGYQLVTNTWYFEKIVINAAASRVDFYLYDDAGALLWTDFLTTNIPTAAGRELAHGVVVTNSGTTAVVLADLDYLSILIPDRRPDL